MQKALVTGAGGYLASRLARILAEDGVHVRALFRSKSNADLDHPNIELVQGDLTDVEKLPEIMQLNFTLLILQKKKDFIK